MRLCNQPIAVFTKLRIVSRPLLAQSGRIELAISPRASATRLSADETPSYNQLNAAMPAVMVLVMTVKNKDKAATTTLMTAIIA